VAKARPVGELRPQEPFAAAAAKVVAIRAAELREHSQGVLDLTDIEPVHDLRVATRRLRAVLEVFAPCFPKRARRSVIADLKRLADALGERRDRDVQINALHEFANTLRDDERAGVRGLIDAIAAERPLANAALAPVVTEAFMADLSERLERLIAAAASKAGPRS
jgi:CHAD domain-containing protein